MKNPNNRNKFLLASAAMALSLPLAVQNAGASVVNLYTFNDGTANDSVGGQNAVAINSPVISGGSVTLANSGLNNANGSTQYIDLPNGLISTASSGGTSGAFSFSIWFIATESRNWATPLSFGTTDGGENAASGAGSSDYIQLIPDTDGGSPSNTFRLTAHSAAGSELGVSQAQDQTAPLNTLINVVGVYDLSAAAGSQQSFYVNGVLVGSSDLPAGLDINTFTNNNNWLGRGQWDGDGAWVGSIDELAIYDNAVDATDAANIYAAGPVAVPEPSAAALMLGAAAAASLRRRRA
ncbi:LamG domain-containing protein [Luteolibacter pohnpeiensis]|uniref:LamG domain-containing protein n=1 Tax=Luteolibacter pohnpeiensis TaxID=454153 RepID=A0A934VPI2_9BACT|nr:LamG domain-containing protein [Luteolibacter pohnpeiensis]MBK1881031.1 LamG domain-containing protein [Luteolibacter pohnpeiensis]